MNVAQMKLVASEWIPRIEQETLTDGTVVFVASHPELPGITAQGDDETTAREIFSECLADYFGELESLGLPRPPATRQVYEISFRQAWETFVPVSTTSDDRYRDAVPA